MPTFTELIGDKVTLRLTIIPLQQYQQLPFTRLYQRYRYNIDDLLRSNYKIRYLLFIRLGNPDDLIYKKVYLEQGEEMPSAL